jgi:hypothetical protein
MNEDVLGLAIVGSYARGEQNSASDVDVCLFVESPKRFFDDQEWVDNFGRLDTKKVENWGVVQTLRVFYRDGFEVEFNYCDLNWAKIPVDPNTYKVVADGMDILFDPTGALKTLQDHVFKKQNTV